MTHRRRAALLGVWLLLFAAAAQAHLLNMTTVQVDVDGTEVAVHVKIDLTRAAGGALDYYRLSRRPATDPEVRALIERLAAAIAIRLAPERHVALSVVSATMPTADEAVFLEPLSWPMTAVELRGALPRDNDPAARRMDVVFLPSFHFEEPIALTIMELPEHRRMTRWLVTAQSSPEFTLSRAAAEHGAQGGDARTPVSTTPLRQFVGFGFLHILPLGLDHVLFVLGLYLGARSMKTLLLLVTCFTLAHSITLGLASVGILRLEPRIVEPLISASIAWVGIENMLRPTAADRYRPFVVFGFGLLHGMGFASALSALDAPRSSFLASLLSFNVGIELGQLTVIAIAFALTAWWRRRSWYRRRIVVPASALIAAIAGVWTVQRVMA